MYGSYLVNVYAERQPLPLYPTRECATIKEGELNLGKQTNTTYTCSTCATIGINDEFVSFSRNSQCSIKRVRAQCQIAQLLRTKLVSKIESKTCAITTTYNDNNNSTRSLAKILQYLLRVSDCCSAFGPDSILSRNLLPWDIQLFRDIQQSTTTRLSIAKIKRENSHNHRPQPNHWQYSQCKE